MDRQTAKAWTERMGALGRAVRDAIIASRRAGRVMSTAVAHEGGDTIFAIDRDAEHAMVDVIERWPDACRPLLLIAEGLGADGRRVFGTGEPRYTLIIDPIDGTRNIMYDKRAAWFIAAVCESGKTSVADAFASVIVELPTSKAGYADTFLATRDELIAQREPLGAPHDAQPLTVTPSAATTTLHGFGPVVNCFPGVKVLAAELAERIAAVTVDPAEDDGAAIFDDQYISTAGQFVELMMGHDRFCLELRPLLYRIAHGTGPVLCCHPYDCAGLLAAQRAGVILTDGFGRALRPPLDIHTPMHWCGYANETLRAMIEPVVQAFLREHGVKPEPS